MIQYKDEGVKRFLEALSRGLGNLSKPFAEAALETEQLVRNTFRTQSDPWGAQWASLSPITVQGRTARDSSSDAILFDTGALFGSIDRASTESSLTIELGGGEIWAGPHQYGNPANKFFGSVAPIPARPFLPIRPSGDVDIPEDWWDSILKPFDALLAKALAS